MRYPGELRIGPDLRHVRAGEVRLDLASHSGKTGARAFVVWAMGPVDSARRLLRSGRAASDRICGRSIGTWLHEFRAIRVHRGILLGGGVHHAGLLSR